MVASWSESVIRVEIISWVSIPCCNQNIIGVIIIIIIFQHRHHIQTQLSSSLSSSDFASEKHFQSHVHHQFHHHHHRQAHAHYVYHYHPRHLNVFFWLPLCFLEGLKVLPFMIAILLSKVPFLHKRWHFHHFDFCPIFSSYRRYWQTANTQIVTYTHQMMYSLNLDCWDNLLIHLKWDGFVLKCINVKLRSGLVRLNQIRLNLSRSHEVSLFFRDNFVIIMMGVYACGNGG